MDNQPEVTVDQKTVEPISQRDDVHNDVAAAIKQLRGEPEPAVEQEQPAPLEQQTEEERSAKRGNPHKDPVTGKFTSKPAETAPAKVAPAQELPSTDNATKPSAQPSTAAGAAPVGWTADAKNLWASLPPAVQEAVIKRETEMSNGGRQWSEEKRRYESVLAPVAQEAQRLGMAPDEAINALMGAHHALQRDPARAIAHLAQQYGVDLQNLASNPPAIQSQPRVDPMVSQLTQTVSTLQEQVNGFFQKQTLGVVEQFAKDHPHYEAVEEDIARIIPVVQQSEPGLSAQEVLQKAYDRAVWWNEGIRAKLIEEQTAQAQKQQAEAVKAKAQQAAKAAVSLKGGSNGASPPPKAVPSTGDVYDDVRAAINQLRQ